MLNDTGVLTDQRRGDRGFREGFPEKFPKEVPQMLSTVREAPPRVSESCWDPLFLPEQKSCKSAKGQKSGSRPFHNGGHRPPGFIGRRQ